VATSPTHTQAERWMECTTKTYRWCMLRQVLRGYAHLGVVPVKSFVHQVSVNGHGGESSGTKLCGKPRSSIIDTHVLSQIDTNGSLWVDA